MATARASRASVQRPESFRSPAGKLNASCPAVFTDPISLRLSLRPARLRSAWDNRIDGRNALPGYVGVRLRRVEGSLLPDRSEAKRHAALLRQQVRLGGDQLHVPKTTGREDPDDL